METQNIQFADQAEQWTTVVDSQPDETFSIADTNDAELGNFFSRPVKIETFSWEVGQDLFNQFNPWTEYFTNPRVSNRISNFNLLRCKLHLKFIINGNSFYYGKAIATYEPIAGLVGNFTANRSTVTEDIVNLSQMPHIFLDPTMSQGGSMLLPFFWYKNAIDIPKGDWNRFGDVRIRSFSPLKHANGATDSITISVFAWAEDVHLSIPTSANASDLSAQAGEFNEKDDEYGKISGPANVVSSIAGKLASVPQIGPFALATKMAADAVGGIARIFGHSKPTDICPPGRMIANPVGNTANTNVLDSAVKLSLDAKQELSIDPRIMGLSNTDEMTIRSIAQRESYLTQFGWEISSGEEDLLWTTEVSPVLWDESAGPPPENQTEYHLTACAFAALPFRFWRGTIKFRFMILNSAYHKGRLAIKYDPNYFQSNEYNTNYVRIIDIAKERDFTVEVGWGQSVGFLNHRDPFLDNVPFGDTTIPDSVTFRRNGVLEVRVVNELTTPNSTPNNNIQILVFVSAGDDFEVANPDDSFLKNATYFPQFGEVNLEEIPIFDSQGGEDSHPDAEGDCDMDMPMTSEVDHGIAPTLSLTDHTQAVYFGDPIVSFRQCLKRWNLFTTWIPLTNDNLFWMTITNSDFPFHRGRAPGALTPTPAGFTGDFNYTNMTLLNYLAPAYLARRGGLRHMYTPSEAFAPNGLFAVRRLAIAEPVGVSSDIVPTTAATPADRIQRPLDVFGSQWPGAHMVTHRQNPNIMVELPFYSNLRWLPARKPNWTTDLDFGKTHKASMYFRSQAANRLHVMNFISVGEDFNLGMYIGPPIIYNEPAPQ